MAMAAVPLVGQIGVFLARHIEGGRILMVFRHVVVPEESVFRHVVVPEESGLQIRAPRWQLQTEVAESWVK